MTRNSGSRGRVGLHGPGPPQAPRLDFTAPSPSMQGRDRAARKSWCGRKQSCSESPQTQVISIHYISHKIWHVDPATRAAPYHGSHHANKSAGHGIHPPCANTASCQLFCLGRAHFLACRVTDPWTSIFLVAESAAKSFLGELLRGRALGIPGVSRAPGRDI